MTQDTSNEEKIRILSDIRCGCLHSREHPDQYEKLRTLFSVLAINFSNLLDSTNAYLGTCEVIGDDPPNVGYSKMAVPFTSLSFWGKQALHGNQLSNFLYPTEEAFVALVALKFIMSDPDYEEIVKRSGEGPVPPAPDTAIPNRKALFNAYKGQQNSTPYSETEVAFFFERTKKIISEIKAEQASGNASFTFFFQEVEDEKTKGTASNFFGINGGCENTNADGDADFDNDIEDLSFELIPKHAI